jgi:hypothetical protein
MSDVITLEQTARELQSKISNIEGKKEKLSALRAGLGYAAHVAGDKGARRKLEELVGEEVGLTADLQSLGGALEVVNQKLQSAKAQAAAVADQEKAHRVLDLVAEWNAAIDKLAEAAAILEAQSKELVAIHSKMSQLGAARPNRAQVDAIAGRAWLTATMHTPWQNQFGTRFLPPNERHVFQDLKQYSIQIKSDAEQRIGATKQEAA